MGLIKYDGVNPFSGQADPLLSMSSSYDDSDGSWSRTDTYSMDGQFTGCTFSSLIERQESLVEAWSSDFKKFEIDQFGIETSGQRITVESISFGDSDYLGAVPYSVSVNATDFSQEPVRDIQDSLSFAENEDGIVSVSHNVSCVGVDTGNCDGLQLAINWVNGRLDISERKPGLIGGVNMEKAQLESISENIDRMGYSYGLSRTFSIDPKELDEPTLRYTTQTCIEEDGTIKKSIRGSVKGGDQYTEKQVDEKFNNLSQAYPYAFSSYSTDYAPEENELGFSFSWEEGGEVIEENVVMNNFSTSESWSHGGNASMNIDGCYEIEKKCGPSVWEKVEKEAGTQESIIKGAMGELGVDEASSWSITYDEKAAKICYNLSHNPNKPKQEGGITDWNVNCVVPLQQFKVVPVLNNDACCDVVASLGYANRATFSITVNATTGSDPTAEQFADNKFKEFCPYAPGLTTTSESSARKQDGGLTYTKAVSFEGVSANTVDKPTELNGTLELSKDPSAVNPDGKPLWLTDESEIFGTPKNMQHCAKGNSWNLCPPDTK